MRQWLWRLAESKARRDTGSVSAGQHGQAEVHHDALEFPSGKIVLLHKLCEGQHATILQLPAVSQIASAASEAEVQKRGVIVA